MERNALVSQKAAAEDEAKQMGFKYAQLLGHQNQRQKIKHLMDLKAKNYDLIEVSYNFFNNFFVYLLVNDYRRRKTWNVN